MPPEASSFRQLREKAWSEALRTSEWACRFGLPVSLRELAIRLNVRRLEFKPLISTGGIGSDDAGGYVIYVNPRAPGAESVTKRHLDLTADEFASFPPPLRFTIAHEMAHVFFFKNLRDECASPLLHRHWEALENDCNHIARVLLLPRPRLVEEWSNQFLDVLQIQAILAKFAVSPEVLVRRLNLPDVRQSLKEINGILALVRKVEGESRIIAYETWGPYASGRYAPRVIRKEFGTGRPSTRKREGLEGKSLETVLGDPRIGDWLAAQNGEFRRVALPWRPGTDLKGELTACRVGRSPAAFIVAIKSLALHSRDSRTSRRLSGTFRGRPNPRA
jgi:hypothetical protein